MNKFLLFVVALIAIVLFLMNLGGMIMFGVSIFLLYLIFRQFMESTTTGSKILWIILGLIVLSMAAAHSYAIIGLLALYILYVLYKKWKEEEEITI